MNGVRKVEEIAGLGLSNRLLVRVGALLRKNLSITAAVLESAKAGAPMESLLLDTPVLERAGNLDTASLRELAASAGRQDLAQSLAINTAPDGVKVLCLQE